MRASNRFVATAVGVCAMLGGVKIHGEGPDSLRDLPRAVSPPISYRTVVERVAVQRVEYVETAEGKKPVVKVSYEDREVSVPDEQAVAKMREELKRLRQLEVDELDPNALVAAVEAERSRRQEREAWTELQKLRKQLVEHSMKFPKTHAAGIAISAAQIVPEAVAPPPSVPGHSGPNHAVSPLPTY